MRAIIFNSCWILGLALLLASFSHQYQQAIHRKRPLIRQLQSRSFVVVAWSSLALVSVGAAGTSVTMWEAVVWILMVVYALWRAGALWLSGKRTVKE